MDDEKIKKLLRNKIKISNQYLNNWAKSINYYDCFPPNKGELVSWAGSIQNLLKQRFGTSHIYYQDFINCINTRLKTPSYEDLLRGNGVIRYILEAMEEGLTDDLFFKRELILFDDFLAQAYEFLKHKHRVASAIYGRIALETAIREYAKNKGMKNTDIKFDQLIIQMRKEGIITKPFENSLRANYSIGNSAAHGNKEFDNITDKEIEEYLSFIRDKVLTLE